MKAVLTILASVITAITTPFALHASENSTELEKDLGEVESRGEPGDTAGQPVTATRM